MKRIGAYGGTFDPIHNGHLEIARLVRTWFELDRMLLIPAYVPPHKDAGSVTSAYHRYAMSVLATVEDDAITVSTIEVEAPHLPYTYETVERLRIEHGPDARLYFVMGADSFGDLRTWKEPERVLREANLIVVTRPGHDVFVSDLPDRFKIAVEDLRGRSHGDAVESKSSEISDLNSQTSGSGLIFLTDLLHLDISSTDIRRRVRTGASIEGLVRPEVAEYIRKYELYGRASQ